MGSFLTEKFVHDDREPMGSVMLPFIEGSFTIYAPNIGLWLQLFSYFFVQGVVISVFGIAIYKFVIKNRGTSLSFLVGYGIIIPLGTVAPVYLSDFFDVESCTIRLGFMITFQTVVFRCIEAMHGTAPPVVQTSLPTYITYLSSLCDVFWNEKTKSRVAVSNKELQTNGWRTITQMLMVSVLHSALAHYNYRPFQSDVQLDQYNLNMDLFKPTQILNNYLNGLMTFLALSFSFNLSASTNNLQGVSYHTVFRNPFFASQSPSDFWGYRWNMIIHRSFKRSVYQPIRNAGYSVTLAILASFLASGLLHDYSWFIMFRPTLSQRDEHGGNCADCWSPIVGKQTAFFMWCGFTMLLERPVGKLPPVQWISQHVPRPIVSTLVVLTVIPFAHWFTGDWVVGHYFDQLSIGLFKITYEP